MQERVLVLNSNIIKFFIVVVDPYPFFFSLVVSKSKTVVGDINS